MKPLHDAQNIKDFQLDLLAWYGAHQRVLPWRAKVGEIPYPYHVWLSEIMLQQTTVAAVKAYFEKFTTLWPRIEDLAAAQDHDVMREWAGLGYYARARNMITCARVVVRECGGAFPQDAPALLKLPGIGPYTAAAIASIAFFKPSVVIDGNIERITARLFALNTPFPAAKNEVKAEAAFLYQNLEKNSGDAASHAALPQALMDLGAMVCVPQNPKCGLCPVSQFCLSFQTNQTGEIPVRSVKIKRPHRQGAVYWIENDRGQILVERRGNDRMLGGMIGFPDSLWDRPQSDLLKNFDLKKCERIERAIKHVFTHFSLELDIIYYKMGEGESVEKLRQAAEKQSQTEQFFVNKDDLETIGFPSLFKKLVSYMKKNSYIALVSALVMAGLSGFLPMAPTARAATPTPYEQKQQAKMERIEQEQKQLEQKMEELNKNGSSKVIENMPDLSIGKDGRTETAVRFVRGTHENIARMMWKFGVFDFSNTDDIDNYILLSDCKTYAFNYDDEFKWRKIQLATVDYLKKYSPNFSNFIEVVQPLELDRYNFDLQGFPLKNPQEMANVTSIQIADEKQQGGLDCRIDRKNSPRYTQTAVLELLAPLNIYFIPATHELAKAYLDFVAKQSAKNVDKFAYVRYRLRVDEFSRFTNITSVGNVVVFKGKLLQLDIFADSDFFLPLFSQKYE